MANYGLFIGFGPPVRGREAKSLDVFNEAMQYYAGLQQAGTIESWEVVLLEPHGGDLNGFFLLRGETEKVNRLRGDREFQRLVARGSLIVEHLGVVGANLGDSLPEQIGVFQEAVAELV
jgi:hypothetical protein